MMQSTTVVGGPHDGKRIALAADKMILRTSSGTYMRHADRPEYLFHVPSLIAATA
ncbi:hypothetical protein SEA_MEMENTOMORI_84 [Microbacterium phage MementoMori]|uniref:Uncharacterized protein n=1 Tax=Microbacterium phage MementoMori TaxID=2201436 RepID=A0A2Z4Q762_9CAUD|nr:hypothetical protein HOT41_gp25 [Microbacterium phage MementoMori]AWY05338.1 hypothetical protein SEA_MEMENTOMORI_84 [Microbacterium phage MementoMori]